MNAAKRISYINIGVIAAGLITGDVPAYVIVALIFMQLMVFWAITMVSYHNNRDNEEDDGH